MPRLRLHRLERIEGWRLQPTGGRYLLYSLFVVLAPATFAILRRKASLRNSEAVIAWPMALIALLVASWRMRWTPSFSLFSTYGSTVDLQGESRRSAYD
jgi:hypothetical protein